MFQYIVLNRSKSTSGSCGVLSEACKRGSLTLETCLREMFILKGSEIQSSEAQNLPEGYSLYKGYQAAEYLINVLSGLESPVLGETEVLGQFKAQVLPQIADKPEFSEFIQFILNMVKLVRSKHIVGQGSQTYGSMVRRLLKSERHLLFVGAGSLAESILPWIKESKKVSFSVRNPEKYKEGKLSEHHFNSLSESLTYDFDLSLVVCAPISSKKLLEHLKNVKVSQIIDLREESREDPIISDSSVRVIPLDEVFKEISIQKERKEKIVLKVKEEIASQIHSRFTKYRPFGWDDLCL